MMTMMKLYQNKSMRTVNKFYSEELLIFMRTWLL